MLRIYRVTGGLIAVFAVWLAAFCSSVPPGQHLAIALTPFFLVLLSGIYSILALVYGVITFRTVPEEAVALRQDIATARNDLQGHNIS